LEDGANVGLGEETVSPDEVGYLAGLSGREEAGTQGWEAVLSYEVTYPTC
jgi:hypothetical protein